MLEYDFNIGLQNLTRENNSTYELTLPKSCVLYLRHNSNTPHDVKVKVNIDNKNSFYYTVPIIKVKEISLTEIFEKKLYMLLPYYIMRYETDKKRIQTNSDYKQKITMEFADIIERLTSELSNGGLDDKRKLIIIEQAMNKIIKHIFSDDDDRNIQHSLGGLVMGGEVYKTIIDELDEAKAALQESNAALLEKDAALQESNAALLEALRTIEELKKKQ